MIFYQSEDERKEKIGRENNITEEIENRNKKNANSKKNQFFKRSNQKLENKNSLSIVIVGKRKK